MKRTIFIVLLCLCWTSLFSQTIINMEENNGVYKIPCIVNGARMKFIFDTGATSVSMSSQMANYLLENDYISKEDIVSYGQSSIADGTIVDHIVINLKDIEISGLHLHNVEAVVLDSQNAPLLLGQSVIQKLGRIEINGNILKILDNGKLDENQIGQLFADAFNALNDGLYTKAKNSFEQLHLLGQLSDYGKYEYARACMHCKDFATAYSVANEIKDFEYFKEEDINIYFLLGWVNEYNDKYDDAIAYYKKAFDFPSATYEDKAGYSASMAFIYEKMKDYQNANKNYQMAILCYGFEYGVNDQYILDDCFGRLKKSQKSYRNDDVDYCVFKYIETAYDAGIYSNKDYLYSMCLLAKNRNTYAIKLCNRAQIDFDSFLSGY